MNMSHYDLRCLGCGAVHPDSEQGFLLSCSVPHPAALLRSEYQNRKLVLRDAENGLFRFADWLPVRRVFPQSPGPVVFHSKGVGPRLGLENLYVIFNGFWPEHGAQIETCSFKELEALAVLARRPESEDRYLVVASAGNTGRAFLQVASRLGVRLVVVVPEFALQSMWITGEKHPDVRLVVLAGNTDYFDAIRLAEKIASLSVCYTEGGARNVARRDGMGTTMLETAVALGRLPDHYVQAVGSGTGGIAAWEMTLRLLADGSYGSRKTTLHLVQNAPFGVMTDAWESHSPALGNLNESRAREQIRELHAPVLSNRQPPYAIRGGVFDALTDTGGHMYSVTNRAALEAGRLFSDLEGCDLDPAAEVALAGLFRAVERGYIGESDVVALNITGGGMNNLERTGRKHYLKPDLIFDAEELRRNLASAGDEIERSVMAILEGGRK
ncbi:MAG TPA: cysteate synthase [Spirochaetia bacterium]|nr:cysteate synthase [Spirochaetia bacterium]